LHCRWCGTGPKDGQQVQATNFGNVEFDRVFGGDKVMMLLTLV